MARQFEDNKKKTGAPGGKPYGQKPEKKYSAKSGQNQEKGYGPKSDKYQEKSYGGKFENRQEKSYGGKFENRQEKSYGGKFENRQDKRYEKPQNAKNNQEHGARNPIDYPGGLSAGKKLCANPRKNLRFLLRKDSL